MNVNDIYTPLQEAKAELERRWEDKELRKKVEEFVGDIPDVFKNGPRVVLSRDIMTPNNEFRYFHDVVDEMGVKPIYIEYLESMFVAKNVSKYHLCKFCVHHGTDKNGNNITTKHNLVDFNVMEGKPLCEIIKLDGEKLVDFHHNLLKKEFPEIVDSDIYNFYDWFNSHRNITDDESYYLKYLALFVCHGVLFENFIVSNGEKEFTETKIIPSFKKLEKLFGLKPLIVPATPLEYENNLFWWYYPGRISKVYKK